ncbi:hypothetical protein K440DRAFT_566606, partial [Wilcoxina mikolae CBS 423.85]
LDDEFHALNLKRLADINIVPTDNLADHLRLDTNDGRRLHVFRCGYFLMCSLMLQRNCFNDDFLFETRRTYHLLFPPWRNDCTDFLRKLQRCNKLDQAIGNIQMDQHIPLILTEPPYVYALSDFPVYGRRLAILRDILDSAKPTSFSQLWYDRRNKQTWYTMWIAMVVFLLTLIFGIISSVTGIMQVWIARNPRKP